MKEFKKYRNLKEKESTIILWIKLKYIKGVKYNKEKKEYNIPSYSLAPYTKYRKSNEDKVYTHIAAAVLNQRDIIPQLFKMSEMRMKTILKKIEKLGYIQSYKEGRYIFYSSTPHTKELMNMSKKRIIELFSIPVAEIVSRYMIHKSE